MKRQIYATSLVDTFLKYHDDRDNYESNPDGFDKMYEILEKYDDSNGNDTVDVAFLKATPEDQRRMIELITPIPKVGSAVYCKQLYKSAKESNRGYDSHGYDLYGEGVLDAFEALAAAGYIDLNEFR